MQWLFWGKFNVLVEIALYYMLENIQPVNLFLIELKYIADDDLCN